MDLSLASLDDIAEELKERFSCFVLIAEARHDDDGAEMLDRSAYFTRYKGTIVQILGLYEFGKLKEVPASNDLCDMLEP